MQDFVYRTKFSLEEVGRGGAKLRNVEEGGETLGVILISRKSRRQGSNMDLSGSLFVFGNGGTPVVLASIRANKKAKVFTVISYVLVFPTRILVHATCLRPKRSVPNKKLKLR